MSNDLGIDRSGNNNSWTVTNLSYSDQMLDSPTNNFATLNPLAIDGNAYNGTLSEGNLKWLQGTGNYQANARSTIAVDSGKWYFEALCVTASGDSQMIGIISETAKSPSVDGSGLNQGNGNPARAFECRGYKSVNTTNTTGWSTAWTGGGDILGVAIDFTGATGSIYLYLNGSLQGGGAAYTDIVLTNKWHFAVSGYSADIWIANFGQDSSFAGAKTAQGNQDGNSIGDFYYAPPTGFLALCTSNLPAVAVVPSEHFNTVLYTGNASDSSTTQVVTTDIQPDLVWMKCRSDATSHRLQDIVRGVNSSLYSDTTGAETDQTGSDITTFGTTSFTLTGNGAGTNRSGRTYVAWNWKANGSGSANTVGDIDSTVSVNTDAGFSIVSYTGNGSDGQTVGHGLSKAPEMILVKPRNYVDHWSTYQEPLGNTKYMYLDGNNAAFTDSSRWSDTTPTSSVFTTGTSSPATNGSYNYIAYCWHSVDGYSKVGSYTGNGSTDGTFVYTGFRPAYLMLKVDAAERWYCFDSARSEYNDVTKYLMLEDSLAENDYGSTDLLDFTSNGFKFRHGTSTYWNGSGNNYIYLAFAETPFKYSNAR